MQSFDHIDPTAPRDCNAKQIRYALSTLGARTTWEAAVPKMSQECQDWWAFNPVFVETSAKISKLCGIVGVSPRSLFDVAVTQ